ncbi:MAG: NAD(P)/FAD-dependent oxidoreductase [Candidatus Paceibacterota bacterium]
MVTKTETFDVCIIGGGPAGLMAAGIAGQKGARVILLEKNEILGKKLLISGGGRCNLTNANPNHRDFVAKYGKKGNFLFTPFSKFGVPETIKFFNDLGLETKIEPGFRVFPVSDKSEDVLKTLVNFAKKNNVEFRIGAEVSKFKKTKNKITAVVLNNKDGSTKLTTGEITAKSFILATGGKSHPETGSTGDGFVWLKDLGHTVIDSNPALVPIKIKESWVTDLSGIAIDKAGISVWINENNQYKKVLSKKGRFLFTHVGLTGPTILNMSKEIGEYLEYGEVKMAIDFFSGVGLDKMHEMMLETFEKNLNKKIKNLVFPEIPTKVYEIILRQLEIDGDWPINDIPRAARLALVEKFKRFEMTVSSLLGVDKAVVTSGGVDLSEVDFKTMSSKLFPNLYFAGDILDFDRPSGGFSLQLCWTTGYVAGQSISVLK